MERIQAIAANFAGWHNTSLTALGRSTRLTSSLWTCETGPAIIFLTAITQGSAEDREQQLAEVMELADRRTGEQIFVADTWNSLRLGDRGFSPSPYGAVNDYFWRNPGPADAVANSPQELTVEEVVTPEGLRDYERASFRGFGSEENLGPLGPFGVHAREILDDPRMRVYVGRVEGETVTGAMAYVSDDLLGIYGVSTLPEHRRRGYGAAVTRAALGAAPDLPAWLDPSPIAKSMYRQIGFESIGQYTAWLRPGDD